MQEDRASMYNLAVFFLKDLATIFNNATLFPNEKQQI